MYKKKCLFRNTNGSWGKEATAIESVWAYLNGVEKKTTGRYRIRITKMSAAEMIAMGMAPENTPVTPKPALVVSLEAAQSLAAGNVSCTPGN